MVYICIGMLYIFCRCWLIFDGDGIELFINWLLCLGLILLMRFYKGVILILYWIRKCLDVCNIIFIGMD